METTTSTHTPPSPQTPSTPLDPEGTSGTGPFNITRASISGIQSNDGRPSFLSRNMNPRYVPMLQQGLPNLTASVLFVEDIESDRPCSTGPRTLNIESPEFLEYVERVRGCVETKDFDPQRCCSVFASVKRTMALLSYHDKLGDSLGIFANVVYGCIDKAEPDFEKLKTMANASKTDIDAYLELRRASNSFSFPLIYAIVSKLKYQITDEEVDAIIGNWRRELTETKYYVNSECLSNNEMRALFQKVVGKVRECKSDSYLKSIRSMLRFVQRKKQNINPFIFICAPSGSGKTAFAYNFATYTCPLIYVLYAVSWHAKTQELYSPFELISIHLKTCIEADMKIIFGIRNDFKVVTCSSIHDNKDLMDVPLRTVHFIVELFAKLIEDKKKEENSRKSWMQLQVDTDRISKGEMSINFGKKRLEDLNQSEPLVVFVDESLLSKETGFDLGEAAKLVLLRSILRLLKCFPFHAGTDARSGNFIDIEGLISNYPESTDIWAVLISSLPQFNTHLLDEYSCIIAKKFPENGMVLSILEFLRSVSQTENPWLIQLALTYLYNINGDERAGEVLNYMFCTLHHAFHKRKMTPKEFTRSQLAYIASRRWRDASLSVLTFQESTINRHFAHLRVIPYKFGMPYCFLKLPPKSQKAAYWTVVTKSNAVSAMKTKAPAKAISKPKDSKDAKAVVEFDPRGVFASFTDAPLTGFTLFGFDTSMLVSEFIIEPPYRDHNDIIGELSHSSRISTLDAVRSHKFNFYTIRGGYFLETLYNSAVIMASRSNGPDGTRFPLFVASFIKELWTAGKSTERFPSGNPTVDFGKNKEVFYEKVIPFLAPMAVTEWSRAAVTLLKRVTNGNCRLGTFMFSTGNEQVDHAILEIDHSSIQLNDVILSTEPPHQKIHNNWIKGCKFNRQFFKGISLAAECKLWRDNITLDVIEKEIVPKFESMKKVKILKKILEDEKGNTDESRDCKTFILFAVNVSKWAKLSESDIGIVKKINRKGYYLWNLERLDVDAAGEPSSVDDCGHYCIKPLDCQGERSGLSKDLIIIPLSVIVGKAFTDKLFHMVVENGEDGRPDEEFASIGFEIPMDEMESDEYLVSGQSGGDDAEFDEDDFDGEEEGEELKRKVPRLQE